MFYVILLLSILIFAFIKRNIKEKKIIDFTIFVTLSVIYGIRYDVGIDYLQYELYYNTSSGVLGDREFLYDQLINLFNYLHIPFWGFSLFIGSIIFYLLYLIAKNLEIPYENVIILFIITGLLFVSFNLVRQTIAGLILLFSFRYITRTDFKKYVGTVVIAGLFHTTAFIFIPFYFIKNLRLNIWLGFILFFLGIILYFSNISSTLIRIITPEKYAGYLDSDYNFTIDAGLGVLFFVFLAIIGWACAPNNRHKIYPFLLTYVLGYSIFLFTLNSFIVNRLTLYSQLALIAVIPFLFTKKRGLQNLMFYINLAIIFFFILKFLASIWGIYQGDTQNLKYKTVFSM
ncbi:EpsG family protein [Halobacillus sp. B23F22_1]|uniref:EpsG family protein n=1 Tax=Halobacillus sp. B23F22_1 TaxID=3459514 RepID=UPI00373F87F7